MLVPLTFRSGVWNERKSTSKGKKWKRERNRKKTKEMVNTEIDIWFATHSQPRRRRLRRNKTVKPYKTFSKSRSVKKWPTVVASLILTACLIVEIIQR